MIENITVDTFDLSSLDESTGLHNTAKVYYVDGIARPLPLAQLVMAICLERAVDRENEVVRIMNKITETTKAIEELSWLENILVGYSDTGIYRAKPSPTDPNPLWGCDWGKILKSESDLPEKCIWRGGDGVNYGRWTDWLAGEFDIGDFVDRLEWENYSPADVNKILDAIDTKLDSLNTTSQKDMILLQSETMKRDQTYDLISVMVKSIGGANTSIAASMR